MKQEYLLTYNPNNVEAHPDSSDFDSFVPLPHIKNKPGYHRLIKTSFGSKARNIYNDKTNCVYSKQDYNIDSPLKEYQANSSLLRQVTNKFYEHTNTDNPPEKRPSRLCVLRQKLKPRFSAIFRQTASNKLEEKHRERKLAYTSSQQCQTCLRKRKKKPYSRKESAIVQPVYAVEAGVHLSKVYIPNGSPKKTYSFTSTSDSETLEKQEKEYKKNSKFKKQFRTEMMREHWNYQHSLKLKYQKHPNTPTDHKPAQQVFNNHQSQLASSISDYSYMAKMPSSGFWDFLFDKMHAKYQVHKCEVKSCSCGESGMLNSKFSNHCCCDPRSPCFDRSSKRNQFPSQMYVPQEDSSVSRSPPSQAYHANKNSYSSLQKPIVKCKCKPPSTKKPKSQGTAPKSPVESPSGSPRLSLQDYPLCCNSPQGPPKCPATCPPKCVPDRLPICTPKSPSRDGTPPVKDDSNRCQEDHDEIKKMLSKKYNGEILCIHNPPCILINGCLNLPSATVEQPTNSFWPVLFRNIPTKKHSRKVRKEKSCQYGHSCDVQQARVPEVNKEEKMETLFSHNAPCDLIKSCDKKKSHLIPDNSCNYVPMCTRMCKRADSVMNRSPWGSLKNYVCDRFPKCQEIQVHSKSDALLNGTENFGAQAQQDTSRACRHSPPCIMVPRCMGGFPSLNNYMQYDVIPDCSHSPVCEAIPACCRNNHKEMTVRQVILE